ncbi:MAG: glucose-6-phosphate dehydrogenase, partial [Gemmatimonadaceae bacterium]
MSGPHVPTVPSARATVQTTAVPERHQADPCTMVIFGAQGDLTRRKLFPAIYQLMQENLVNEKFAVLGVGRDDSMTDDTFRDYIRKALSESDEVSKVDDTLWQELCRRMFFVAADLNNPQDYTKVGKRLAEIEIENREGDRNRLFYLAVPPSVFEAIVRNLSSSGLAPRTRTTDDRPWYRIVVEKPFGRSLDSAQQLNDLLLGLFAEHQTYRIDHYLGKETVQNVLVLRFANSIFEPLWNRQWIDHVQITAAETVGVEERGKYYEEAGVVR